MGERGDGAAPVGQLPTGAVTENPLRGERQLRDARASFQVGEGRMIVAALAGSGW